VDQALERLRTDTSCNEVRLDPSNSFFRRLQHKKAVSEGFFSFSTGEGMARAVVVTRDRPADEEETT
jgi:predicted RNA-binding protein Jag